MDLGLKNARVFVAASSKGLGAATARQFSREGARVAINARNAQELDATAAAIRKETGGDVYVLPGDVTDADVCKELIASAAARMGGLDILVTNAGGPPPGSFNSTEPDAYYRAFDLSMMSAVHLIRAAVNHLRHSDRAAILTVTSVSVKQPIENLILSNTVRMGVIGLTKSLANELGPDGIRVNSILPGWTRTERVDELMGERALAQDISVDEAIAERASGTPLRRMGEPEEFANVAVFMCSPAAGYLHGAMIPVDGGATRATL